MAGWKLFMIASYNTPVLPTSVLSTACINELISPWRPLSLFMERNIMCVPDRLLIGSRERVCARVNGYEIVVKEPNTKEHS